VSQREVVEHTGAVAVLPLHEDGSVSLVDQYRHAVGRRMLELPAGLLDTGSEDPVATARRELMEEVGITAREWAVLVDVVSSPGFSDEAVRVFLAQGLTEVGRPESHLDEEADLSVVRLPLGDAVHRVLVGEILNASTVAGLLAAHVVLAGAARPRPVDAPWPHRPWRFTSRRRPAQA
jgi:ADP-ribose pyrophosphatase